jgi:MATE family multidrug resistance protein
MTSLLTKSNIKTEIREFLRLAIPLASAQVAQAGTGFVDTVMMGWLGQKTLAAGGLASMTFMALLMTAIGVVAGVSPLVSQAYGAGRIKGIGQVTRQGLWLALILAISVMILMTHMDGIMRSLGQEASTVTLAKTYIDVMMWGFFPALGFAVLRGAVASVSLARPVMFIVICATLFNTVGNYVLAFGKLGFPKMGLAGLALASILAHWGMFLSLLIYILAQKQMRTYRVFDNIHLLEPGILWELVKLGVPLGIAAALEAGLFTTVTYLMGILGSEVLAAHQIVLQTTIVIFMIPLAMSYAATVRVGQWSGQQNYEAARRAGYVSIGLGAIFMTVMAVVLLLYPQQVIGLYVDIRNPENAKVLQLAIPMLTVAAVSQILDGVQKTANGALQGLKDTRIPMLLSLIAYWGVGLTSGYFLGFPLGFGGVGLWLGQSIGIAMAALVFVLRFRKLMS